MTAKEISYFYAFQSNAIYSVLSTSNDYDLE